MTAEEAAGPVADWLEGVGELAAPFLRAVMGDLKWPPSIMRGPRHNLMTFRELKWSEKAFSRAVDEIRTGTYVTFNLEAHFEWEPAIFVMWYPWKLDYESAGNILAVKLSEQCFPQGEAPDALVVGLIDSLRGLQDSLTLDSGYMSFDYDTGREESPYERMIGATSLQSTETANQMVRGYEWGTLLQPTHIEALGGAANIGAWAPVASVEQWPNGALFLRSTVDINHESPEQVLKLRQYLWPVLPKPGQAWVELLAPTVPSQLRCSVDLDGFIKAVAGQLKQGVDAPTAGSHGWRQAEVVTDDPIKSLMDDLELEFSDSFTPPFPVEYGELNPDMLAIEIKFDHAVPIGSRNRLDQMLREWAEKVVERRLAHWVSNLGWSLSTPPIAGLSIDGGDPRVLDLLWQLIATWSSEADIPIQRILVGDPDSEIQTD